MYLAEGEVRLCRVCLESCSKYTGSEMATTPLLFFKACSSDLKPKSNCMAVALS